MPPRPGLRISFMEISNIWFYSLSTSAQVVGALVGLYAVFVVSKISAINAVTDELNRYLNTLLLIYWEGDSNINENMLQGGSYKEKLDFLNKNLKQKRESSPEPTFSNTKESLQKLELANRYADELRKISRNLIAVLLWGFAVITFDIGCLSFAEASLCLLGVNFLIVVLMLILIGWATYSAVRSDT